MLVHLLLAFFLIGASVIIHGFGTLELQAWLANSLQRNQDRRGRIHSGLLTIRMVSSLLVLHLLEASSWAVLNWLAQALPDGETAFYFSLTSYTTVGYGDVVLPPDWRLLGPLEAATGILMFGWSTGIMVAAITRIYGDQFRRVADTQEPGLDKQGK
ncbi:MAG: potassium channel family protein [Gemmatales bacterium]